MSEISAEAVIASLQEQIAGMALEKSILSIRVKQLEEALAAKE